MEWYFKGMERIEAGRAQSAPCEVIRPREDALIIPELLADKGDAFWLFAGASKHPARFLACEGRTAL
jgi:hypothetical protein